MSGRYVIGLDFGSNSMRAIVADVRNGRELASYAVTYAHGDTGIIIDPAIPEMARQHPADYLQAIEKGVRQALEHAATDGNFSVRDVIGIGVCDEDRSAASAGAREVEPQIGAVAARIDDDGFGRAAFCADDVAVRADRTHLVAVDDERHDA